MGFTGLDESSPSPGGSIASISSTRVKLTALASEGLVLEVLAGGLTCSASCTCFSSCHSCCTCCTRSPASDSAARLFIVTKQIDTTNNGELRKRSKV